MVSSYLYGKLSVYALISTSLIQISHSVEASRQHILDQTDKCTILDSQCSPGKITNLLCVRNGKSHQQRNRDDQTTFHDETIRIGQLPTLPAIALRPSKTQRQLNSNDGESIHSHTYNAEPAYLSFTLYCFYFDPHEILTF